MRHDEPAKNADFNAFPTESQSQADMGLTKREYFAAKAMQGLLAHRGQDDPEWFAQSAVEYADALIAALNKEETK